MNESLQQSPADGRGPNPCAHRCDEVLVALRRVIRAVDLHSRALVRSHGLTAPQALVLKEIVAAGELPVGAVAQRVSLSHATITDILNRLERRGLVARTRSDTDRRRVLVRATPDAKQTLKRAPPLLQESFASRFAGLADWEQTMLLASLQRIAALMDAERIDAAPVLAPGSVSDAAEPAGTAAPQSAGSDIAPATADESEISDAGA
ncbi:MAG: MarR family transcriptional regulator [Thiohalocapsa sp.]|uniref:MarR family winged helix-turn-helix transcriptional regulator n=1 Tax=Thiohalocapsa sp. TaxID=2497641 RepID=UPI0025F4480A|nr:MarR family transcriptional regulator [Thiohalocapsa sp.]MCG6942993.1 MarR family transcriptional regulator [Thiohalocapsa sp.]